MHSESVMSEMVSCLPGIDVGQDILTARTAIRACSLQHVMPSIPATMYVPVSMAVVLSSPWHLAPFLWADLPQTSVVSAGSCLPVTHATASACLGLCDTRSWRNKFWQDQALCWRRRYDQVPHWWPYTTRRAHWCRRTTCASAWQMRCR